MAAAAEELARAALAASLPVARLDIWSFNLRTEFQDAKDGPDGWSQRRQHVAEFIRKRRPGLICAQEATEAMLEYLVAELGEEDHGWVGSSRSLEKPDETAGVLFDRRVFEVAEHETAWLRDESTPEGIASWDAALPRTVETVLLALRGTSVGGAPAMLRVVNTHLDHVGLEARERSAELIAESMRRWAATRPNSAQILCGDFNSPKGNGNVVYRTLTGAPTELRDAAREAPESGPNVRSTIHKFEGVAFEDAKGDGTVDLGGAAGSADDAAQELEAGDALHIDWILWRDGAGLRLRPAKYQVMTDPLPTGRYPSDHFPISATFEVLRGAPGASLPSETGLLSKL